MLKKLLVASAIGLVAVNATLDITQVTSLVSCHLLKFVCVTLHDQDTTSLTPNDSVVTPPTIDLPDNVTKPDTVADPVISADNDAVKPSTEQDAAASDAAKEFVDSEQKTEEVTVTDNDESSVGFGRQFGIWEMTAVGAGAVVAIFAAIFGVKKCKRSPPPSSRYGTNLRRSPV